MRPVACTEVEVQERGRWLEAVGGRRPYGVSPNQAVPGAVIDIQIRQSLMLAAQSGILYLKVPQAVFN